MENTFDQIIFIVRPDQHADGEEDSYKRVFNTRRAQIGVSSEDIARGPQAPNSPPILRGAQLHREILPDLLGTTSGHSLDSISERIDFAFNSPGRAEFELKGAGSPTEILRISGEMANSGEFTWDSIMKGSSFAVPLAMEDSGMPMVLWGNGSGWDVSNDANSRFDWEGDTAMGHLGLDATVGNGLLLGIATSLNESSVDFELHEFAGRYNVCKTSFNPYLAWSDHDLSTQLKFSAGLGIGEVEIDYEDYHPETAASLQHSFLIGIREELASFQNGNGIQAELALDTEFRMARQFVRHNGRGIAGATAGSRNLQVSLEGTLERTFPSGSVLSPTLSIGANWKGGSYDPGGNLDLKSGVKFAGATGLGASVSNHIRFPDDSNNAHELECDLSYDSNNDNIGLLMDTKLKYQQNGGYLTRSMEVGYGFMPGSNVKLGLDNDGNNSRLELNSTFGW